MTNERVSGMIEKFRERSFESDGTLKIEQQKNETNQEYPENTEGTGKPEGGTVSMESKKLKPRAKNGKLVD